MKHYHVTSGLRGGYIPNADDQYTTKRDAIRAARDLVAEYRENGEKVRGGTFAASEAGTMHGRWIMREGIFPGEFYDYVTVTGPCSEDCESDTNY